MPKEHDRTATTTKCAERWFVWNIWLKFIWIYLCISRWCNAKCSRLHHVLSSDNTIRHTVMLTQRHTHTPAHKSPLMLPCTITQSLCKRKERMHRFASNMQHKMNILPSVHPVQSKMPYVAGCFTANTENLEEFFLPILRYHVQSKFTYFLRLLFHRNYTEMLRLNRIFHFPTSQRINSFVAQNGWTTFLLSMTTDSLWHSGTSMRK